MVTFTSHVSNMLYQGLSVVPYVVCCFCFKQKTAYEMRISDWSSDVCSSDLPERAGQPDRWFRPELHHPHRPGRWSPTGAAVHRSDRLRDPARSGDRKSVV